MQCGLYIGALMRSAVFDWQLVVYLAWTSWSWGAWSFPRTTPSGSVLPPPCHLIHIGNVDKAIHLPVLLDMYMQSHLMTPRMNARSTSDSTWSFAKLCNRIMPFSFKCLALNHN
jgi:hypothetical protein